MGQIALIIIWVIVIYNVWKRPTFLKEIFKNKDLIRLGLLIILLAWLLWVTYLHLQDII